ncbi:magnesium and cobalt transport protein CorA [Kineosporia sp. J2-2]|uniref:Magnesium and cobalt transport protein CorA n=1 Tax=Kineosporia corallincola TaxID=2835133 RepID=A0ABS5TH38_9ACTN|nr:magnesium and cobalt transport protein CorA [Kineosporia corallincola]MBT0770387.1 magnesium and cobalt transport protein CorA [Kineosporia corallincola]
MARTNRTGLARSLALPRTQLRNVYPALRYGPLDVLKQRLDTETDNTAGLLEAAVDWGLYRDGHRMPSTDFHHAVETAREGAGFVWLGLHEPSPEQLEQLGEVFSLHPLALEDAASARQRPKLERHENDMFLAMRTLAYVDSVDRDAGGDVVETGAVMVFVGEWFVITVRHGKHTALASLRRRMEEDTEQLSGGPSAVLHAVADKVVDDYLAVVDSVQQDLEEIESTVFAPRGNTDIERIYQLKRDVIEMKRTVQPLTGPLRELSERPRRLIHAEIREYFRDVSDHLSRVHEQVAGFDELLTSILQAGLARVSIAENEDMRKISAWVAIAAVPTMIAGIYGMNFDHMWELRQPWGYPAVLCLMATICAGLFRGFKRNGWL